MTTKPELIDTGSDERFVRRNEKGQFKSDDLGCLSADRHRTAKTKQGLVRATGIGRSGIIRSPLELASTADKSFKSAGETGMSLKCLVKARVKIRAIGW